MINYIIKQISKLRNYRARKAFLKSVIYKGKNMPEIRSGAYVVTFRGSTKNDIEIGDNFRFWGGHIISQNGGKIRIGDMVKFGTDFDLGCGNSVTIGSGSTFGAHVTIMDNNNHSVNPLDRAIMYQTPRDSDYRGYKYSDSAPIVIGKNVWCGSYARINKGVTIGDGAVIAANTVVVKDVPANAICAGNPGKIVKENIDKLPRHIPDSVIYNNILKTSDDKSN